MVVVLGTFAFQDFELPEEMPFGGQQTLIRHRGQGGKRTIDVMGHDDAPIQWRGKFRGPLAMLRARQVDTMRRAGKPLIFTWDTFFYRVVIQKFEGRQERPGEVPYSITLEIIQDLIADALADVLESVEDAITGGLSDALGLSVDSPVLTGIVTGAQSAVASVATNGSFDLSTLSGAARAGLGASLGSAAAAAGGVSNLANGALATTGLSVALSGPVSGMAKSVMGLAETTQTASTAEAVANDLRVADVNLQGAPA